jgi:hypothetical protein
MAERGTFRPVWITVSIVTCVIVGSTLNRCLTCGEVAPTHVPVATLTGEPFLKPAPPAPPDTRDGQADEPPTRMIEPRPPPAAPPVEPEPPRPAELADHEDLTFDKLASYAYEMPALEDGTVPKDQIPASVRDLHGRKIAIRGFMIPYRNDGEVVTEFILLRNQGLCCFGIVPRMNEWIHVRMKAGEGAPYATDVPLTVFGALEVGEVCEKGPMKPGQPYDKGLGAIMSVYRMEATVVLVPPTGR